MTPKRIGVKGGTVVCSSASSKYHGLDKLLFYFPVYVSTAASIPASTLTSAVWQNSTKAGLLESKETVQVL